MQTAGPACRLPAEWEPQSGIMLTWPHPATDWCDSLERVEPVFAAIGAAVTRHESLMVVAQDRAHADHILIHLERAGAQATAVHFAQAPTDDTWARDHGPLTCLSADGPQLNDFVFNGWGGKFEASRDNAISRRLHEAGCFGNTALHTHPFVLEGGAIETDGQGTLLATRHSVISSSRNPGLDQAAVERHLTRCLGLDRFLWLDHGALSGDDTDGHIDTLARFAGPDTILHVTASEGDPDRPGLLRMAGQLAGLRDRKGRPYRLVALPPAGLHRDGDGRRLPATYANFLVINDAVLLPSYGVPADEEACAVLRDVFPRREIIPIDCRAIITQNGSLHCLTMQFPAALTLQSCL